MPRLLALLPEARLPVWSQRLRRRLADRVAAWDHQLTANAVDLASIYARAAATAMPLTEGGRTRLKDLEAMAVGCPIVATVVPVEGLGFKLGVHFYHVESAGDFVRAIAGVLAAPEAPERMAGCEQNFVLAQHAPEARIAAIRFALSKGGLLAVPDADA